jgi:hypothetical protein
LESLCEGNQAGPAHCPLPGCYCAAHEGAMMMMMMMM